jgi:hypothetical protein
MKGVREEPASLGTATRARPFWGSWPLSAFLSLGFTGKTALNGQIYVHGIHEPKERLVRSDWPVRGLFTIMIRKSQIILYIFIYMRRLVGHCKLRIDLT